MKFSRIVTILLLLSPPVVKAPSGLRARQGRRLIPWALRGRVFDDVNGNGVFDSGDGGFRSVRVDITWSDSSTTQVVTDEEGFYLVDEVAGGITGATIEINELDLPYSALDNIHTRTAGDDHVQVDLPVSDDLPVLHGYKYHRTCVDVLNGDPESPDGVYKLFPAGVHSMALPEPLMAYCDMSTDGGGWMLLYAYNKLACPSAPASCPDPFPALVHRQDGTLPTNPNGYSHSHIIDIPGYIVSDTSEVRFHCTTDNANANPPPDPNQPRSIHFKTSSTAALSIAWSGSQMFNSWVKWNDFTLLEGHNANLPWSINNAHYYPEGGFWDHPFFQSASAHWNIRYGGYRYECDDYTGNSAFQSTMHRVFVRMGTPEKPSCSCNDFEELNEQVSHLESGVAVLETNNAAHATSISGIATDVANLQAQNTVQAASISDIESDVLNLETDVTNLQGENAAQATSISNLQTDGAGQAASIAVLETNVAAQTASISELEVIVEGIQLNVSALQDFSKILKKEDKTKILKTEDKKTKAAIGLFGASP